MFIIDRKIKKSNNPFIKDVIGFTCGNGYGFFDESRSYLIMFWEKYGNVPELYLISPEATLEETVTKNHICNFEDIDFIAFDEKDFSLIFQEDI